MAYEPGAERKHDFKTLMAESRAVGVSSRKHVGDPDTRVRLKNSDTPIIRLHQPITRKHEV